MEVNDSDDLLKIHIFIPFVLVIGTWGFLELWEVLHSQNDSLGQEFIFRIFDLPFMI